MINITPVTTVDETAYDHVKCPQCKTRLCGKPKGTKVHILRVPMGMSTNKSPLLFTCRRCKNHYLVSTEE